MDCKNILTTAKTARRLDAEAGIRLSKRRLWFTDPPVPEVSVITPPAGGDDTHGDWFKSLPPEAQREIEGLRRENQQKGEKLRLQAEEQRKADEKRMTEQQEWQKLAEQRKTRIDQLEPLEQQFTALEESTKTANEKRIAAIPDSMKSLVPPNLSPLAMRDWLDVNQAIFAAPLAPNMGAGALGDQQLQQKPKLTPAQQTIARRLRLTDEEYIKAM